MTQAPDEHEPTNDTGITDTVADLVLDRVCEIADKPNGDAKQKKKKPVEVGLNHPPIPVPARPAPTPSLAGDTS